MPTPTAPRPEPFSAYTTPAFWDDPHVSAGMLALHLDPDAELASRRHDVVDRSVDWLVGHLGLTTGARVLDLGCGPGLYAHRLARRGVGVTGIDVSRRSIAHARAIASAEGLPAEFRRASYLEADLGSGYDAALLVYEDFCALSPAQRAGLLRAAARALVPDGAFVMDVTAAARFASQQPFEEQGHDLDGGFWAPSPYEGLHERWTYPDLRLVLDRYTIDDGASVRQFWNWTHCLTPAEVTTELARAGFARPELFGDLTGAPFDPDGRTFAVVAQRTPPGGDARA